MVSTMFAFAVFQSIHPMLTDTHTHIFFWCCAIQSFHLGILRFVCGPRSCSSAWDHRCLLLSVRIASSIICLCRPITLSLARIVVVVCSGFRICAGSCPPLVQLMLARLSWELRKKPGKKAGACTWAALCVQQQHSWSIFISLSWTALNHRLDSLFKPTIQVDFPATIRSRKPALPKVRQL